MKYIVWHKRTYTTNWTPEEFETLAEVAAAVMQGQFATGFIITRRMGITIKDAEECDVKLASEEVLA